MERIESKMPTRISQNASVSGGAKIAESAAVSDFSQVRENVNIGENTIIGSYVYTDANVKIGQNCKIQNSALIYKPAIIHEGVSVGPGAILTNDKHPRSISETGQIKTPVDWEKTGVEVVGGALISEGALCVAPITIGKCASVGAGAAVTKSVKSYALFLGGRARQVGWVSAAGVQLQQISETIFECPKTMTQFKRTKSELHEII